MLPLFCCSVVFLGFDFCKRWMRKSKPKENTAQTGDVSAGGQVTELQICAVTTVVPLACLYVVTLFVSCRDIGLRLSSELRDWSLENLHHSAGHQEPGRTR